MNAQRRQFRRSVFIETHAYLLRCLNLLLYQIHVLLLSYFLFIAIIPLYEAILQPIFIVIWLFCLHHNTPRRLNLRFSLLVMALRLCYRTTNALGQDGHHLKCVYIILLFCSSFRGLKR